MLAKARQRVALCDFYRLQPTLGDSDTEDLLAAHCWAPGTGRSMFVDEGYAVSLRSVDTKLVMLQGHQRAGGMHVSVVS